VESTRDYSLSWREIAGLDVTWSDVFIEKTLVTKPMDTSLNCDTVYQLYAWDSNNEEYVEINDFIDVLESYSSSKQATS
jgi:hypothetical protein